MLNISDIDLIKFSIESLRDNYFDEDKGGFFDFVKGTKAFKTNSTLKKLNYNCVCAIGLSQVGEIELLEKAVHYLSGLRNRHRDLVPTWEVGNRFTNAEQPQSKYTLGEQGLLLWALSKAYPLLKWDKLREQSKNTLDIIYKHANGGMVYHFPHSKRYVPMTMAFILDGLLEYYLITKDYKCGEKIKEIAAVLLKNGTPPVFYILENSKISENIYFNNLAYPIHALSRYCIVFDDKDAKNLIERVIERLLHLQGELGQWYWVYSPSGKVIHNYPVYSVHQCGMAGMALKMAKKIVDKELGLKIDKAIEKSFLWVLGNNELKMPLIDSDKKLIWRCLGSNPSNRLSRYISKFINSKNKLCQVNKDCRSYEYGWLLYAGQMNEGR